MLLSAEEWEYLHKKNDFAIEVEGYGAILIDDLFIKANSTGILTGYLLDLDDITMKELDHASVLKLVAAEGSKYELSIKNDNVLYKGIPFYSYAYKKEWGKGPEGASTCIDKDLNTCHSYGVHDTKSFISNNTMLECRHESK